MSPHKVTRTIFWKASKKQLSLLLKTGTKSFLGIVVILLLVLTVSSCVSNKRYYYLVALNARLKSDSTKSADIKKQDKKRIYVDSLRIARFKTDSINRIMVFDTTVNGLIKDANGKIDNIKKRYIQTQSNQSKRLNLQLSSSLKFMFAPFITKKGLEVVNDPYQVKIILHADSLYDKDLFTYNNQGADILKKINSAEFKNLIQDYFIESKNMFVYQDSLGKADSVNISSIVFEDFRLKTKTLRMNAMEDVGRLPLPPNSGREDIVMVFSKEYEPLDFNYIGAKAHSGALFKTYEVTSSYKNITTQTSNSGDIAITYGILSDKYLLNISDFRFFNFADITDEQVFNKINAIKKSHPRDIIKLSGNDKQTVACGETKAIIVTANGKVLKRIDSRTITCKPDTLKL